MKDKVENGRMSDKSRDRLIIKTSFVGILTNLVLTAFKAFIGIMSNSIAVTLDAVNNLSDALSSVITIIGTKLAGKLPDRRHPFGYGRIEYISAMLVSGIILYAGITAGVESVKKIINPQLPEYSYTSLVIIAVAVLVKVVLGRYVQKKGEEASSTALTASGKDALFDAVLSLSVLICAVIFTFTGISLEAYVGVVISIFIIKAGVEMIVETLDEILGMRADKALTDRIKKLITKEPQVQGAYDLVMYNYGPDKNYASVHIELPDVLTVEEVDRLTRRLETTVYNETGVVLAGVGVYSINTQSSEVRDIEERLKKAVLSHPWAVQLHGFYLDIKAKEMRFDVVLSFDIRPKEALDILYTEVRTLFPGYDVEISPDIDISTTD